MRAGWHKVLILLCFIPISALAELEGETAYNEIYDASGAVRPAYRAFQQLTGVNPLQPGARHSISLAQSHPMGDANQIFPIPLILSAQEYDEVVVPGVKQRLRALLRFAEDGLKNDPPAIVAAGKVPTALLRIVLTDVGIKSAAAVWDEMSKMKHSAFATLYGPDLARGPDGRFYVIEDNLGGSLGGLGDQRKILQSYLHGLNSPLNGQWEPTIESLLDDPIGNLVKWFQEKHSLSSEDPLLALLDAYQGVERMGREPWNDLENNRIYSRMQALGILPLGFSDSNILMHLLDRTRDLKGILNFSDGHGEEDVILLMDAVVRYDLPVLRNPFLDFLGHKLLLPFVGEMIRFYLNEEPELGILPTEIVDPDKLSVDSDEPVFIKLGNSSQGTHVDAWHLMSKNSREELIASIRNPKSRLKELLSPEVPSLYVKQRAMSLSVLNGPGAPEHFGYRIDIRPYALSFDLDDIRASKLPWGRTSPIVAQQKNNVSQGAYELPVIKVSCAARIAEGAGTSISIRN